MPPLRPSDRDEVVEVSRLRARGGQVEEHADELAVEAPLEIRVEGVPLAVVMRTPGEDEALVRGFLQSEGIVARPEDILRVRHCDRVEDPDAEDNVMEVRLAPALGIDLARFRRNLYATSSCGVCGKASIERALETAPPFACEPAPRCLPLAIVTSLPERLGPRQSVFLRTGGLHAAALVDATGEIECVYEDVGRHNAVDKVIGATPLDARRAGASLLVSGRVSFEVVQKALAARVQRIIAVSAPTSLAVDLARRANMSLVAFVRGDNASVYAGELGD